MCCSKKFSLVNIYSNLFLQLTSKAMEIIQRVIKTKNYSETVFCYKTETVGKDSYLLGFKDSLPMLSNLMPKNINMTSVPGKELKRTVRVETNSHTGEKFIMLNGKKIKILAESELPKNSQITKLASLQNLNNSNCPVKIKILKGISKKNDETQNPSTNHINLYPINNDKKVTSQISIKKPVNEIKFSKIIPISSVENIIANTTDKSAINGDSMRMLKIDKVGKKPIIVNKTLLNNLMSNSNNIQCAALDLTKNFASQESISGLMKKDKDIQVELKPVMVNREVQTDDNFDGDLESLLKLDIFDLALFKDSDLQPIQPTNNVMNSNDEDIHDFAPREYANLNHVSPNKNIENSLNVSSKNSTKSSAENFFKELRTALVADEQGNMPIHIGVLTNDLKLVKRNIFLLKLLRQSLDIRNNNDYTSLQLAVIHNAPVNIFAALLTNGASVSEKDPEGNNLIHYAVEYERAEALKWLLNHGGRNGDIINEYNHEGLTPLMICCLNSSYDCAELLLDNSANANVKDQISGRTALFHAAERHDVDMVEMLLQFNACTKTKNFFGTSPHDAMYEIDDMPEEIKFMILGKNKRKAVEEPRPTKFKKTELTKTGLKTYARIEKIQVRQPIKTYTTVK